MDDSIDDKAVQRTIRAARKESERRHNTIKHMASGLYEQWIREDEGHGSRALFDMLARKAWDAAAAFHDHAEVMSQEMIPGGSDDE